MQVMKPLLTDRKVAELLNISLSTIRKWRVYGKGPRFVKHGAAVRYREEDVRAWIESGLTGGAGSQTEALDQAA